MMEAHEVDVRRGRVRLIKPARRHKMIAIKGANQSYRVSQPIKHLRSRETPLQDAARAIIDITLVAQIPG